MMGWTLIAALALVATGCGRQSAKAPANPNEKRYPLTGEILAVKPEEKILRVKHDEIPGFMPAMTMDFAATEGDLAIAKPGKRIRAELVTLGDGEFHLPHDLIVNRQPVMGIDVEQHTRPSVLVK